ncbi:MAG: LysM peptidoglycan-binding domain-containing protein [Spirochaetia bacterium]|nr:LysM peptidoglycan-binding domain-containing protein [Spirochaetia bacterium]
MKKVLVVLAVFVLASSFIGCAARTAVKPDATPEPALEATVEESAAATPVPVKKAADRYVVKKGDTLWDVSSMSKIYSDSFQWPLLYKANRDQISDPDLIEVGQELDVRKDISADEKEDAIQKAKDTPPYRPHTAPRKTLPLKY